MTGLLYDNNNRVLFGLGGFLNYQDSALFSTPQKKRKVFFSFHYDDIMRVNNVRNAWRIEHPDSVLNRTFYDSSLWESKKAEGEYALKKLIREGVEQTSTVCVLIGSETWSRRWVKYEIARSIIDGRGLLAVHINSLNHHKEKTPYQHGYNPLHLLGIYKSEGGQFYIYEKLPKRNYLTNEIEWKWQPYKDYTKPVYLPRYLKEPDIGYIMPLSTGTKEYDFVAGNGHRNIGHWIDQAAQAVGR